MTPTSTASDNRLFLVTNYLHVNPLPDVTIVMGCMRVES